MVHLEEWLRIQEMHVRNISQMQIALRLGVDEPSAMKFRQRFDKYWNRGKPGLASSTRP
jgi:hypothetical protein